MIIAHNVKEITEHGSKQLLPNWYQRNVNKFQIFQAITDPSRPQLPKVCYHEEDLSGMDLNTAIKLCLTDPQFPAFVGRVEAELEKIMSE